LILSTLIMEARSSSEISALTRAIRHHVPDDDTFHWCDVSGADTEHSETRAIRRTQSIVASYEYFHLFKMWLVAYVKICYLKISGVKGAEPGHRVHF
jgi:hypothetical protein